jgi:hypothetical protein
VIDKIGFVWVCFCGGWAGGILRNWLLEHKLRLFGHFANWVCFVFFVIISRSLRLRSGQAYFVEFFLPQSSREKRENNKIDKVFKKDAWIPMAQV